MERVQRVVRAVEPHDSVERYTGLGVEVIEGTAKIVSPWEVEVTRTGGATRAPDARAASSSPPARGPSCRRFPGLDEVGYLTSDTVWNLRELPGAWWCWAAGRSAAS